MTVSSELKDLHNAISFTNAGTSREERIKIMEAAAEALGKQRTVTPGAEYLMKLLPTERRFIVTRYPDVVLFSGEDAREPQGSGTTLESAIASHICLRMGFSFTENTEPTKEKQPETKKPAGNSNGHVVEIGGVVYPSKKAALLALFKDGERPQTPTGIGDISLLEANENFFDEMAETVGCSASHAKSIYMGFLRNGEKQ